MGKPALSDMRNGHVTAAALYASQTHPDILTMVKRKLVNNGDEEMVSCWEREGERARGIYEPMSCTT